MYYFFKFFVNFISSYVQYVHDEPYPIPVFVYWMARKNLQGVSVHERLRVYVESA
jgi:hypothetical protein